MANANSGIPRGQVITGARGYLTVNGKQVGYVMNVSYQESINQLPVEALGDLLTTEFVTAGVTYSGSIGRVEVFGSTTTDVGLTVPLDQAYTAPAIGLALTDEPNGKIYRTFEGVKFTGKGIDFSKGSMSMANLSFVCILSRDQNGIIEI
jgi:hypothetical protein